MSTIAVESQPSPPSVAPFPQPGMKGGGSGEGSLDFRALLSSLCPDPAAECQSWPCADPQWEGWFKNDWRGWPEWVTGFRDHQLHAIVEIVDAYARGADVVFLDAPTGAGKTLVAEAVRRLVSKASVYVCHSLGLQEQMVTDFPYAAVLKGRSNYPTQTAPFPEITCADCTLTGRPEAEDAECTWCPEPAMCSYVEVRKKAFEASVAVTNTAYLLAEANNVGRLLGGRELVIADEADTLEAILMGTAEFRVSAGIMRKVGVEAPKKGSHSPTIAKWMTGDLMPALKIRRAKLPRNDDVEVIRERYRLTRLIDRVAEVAGEILGDGWVRDYDRTDSLILKPVHVGGIGDDWVWRHSSRWLLMSATLVSTDEMVESLGMQGMKAETVTVPMTFPVENRTIHAVPIAAMTAANKDEAWPAMARAIKGIQELHPEDKILVHTVSYELAKYLSLNARGEGRAVYNYNDSTSRDQAVQQFKDDRRGLDVFDVEGRRPAIMFAPSLDRGFDFKGDEARVVVVAKVPYPYLGDSQISARLNSRGGQLWYTVQAVRSLIQMTGRGVRSKDDWCKCVAPQTRILTRDLCWVRADSLQRGDGLWGFDEWAGTRKDRRKWRPAVVQATGIETLERMKITLEDGTELISTPDHRWVCKEGQAKTQQWVRTDQLKPGYHLNRYVQPWNEDNTRDGGYLAGLWDGEGCLSVGVGQRNRNVIVSTIAQKEGVVMRKIRYLMHLADFNFGESMHADSQVNYLVVRGGLSEQLRLLGQIRPVRLLKKLVESDFAPALMADDTPRVVSVERLLDGPMVTLQSSTETYFAEGFGAHNTYILDSTFLTKLWKKDKRLLPKWWREAVDTGTTRRDLGL